MTANQNNALYGLNFDNQYWSAYLYKYEYCQRIKKKIECRRKNMRKNIWTLSKIYWLAIIIIDSVRCRCEIVAVNNILHRRRSDVTICVRYSIIVFVIISNSLVSHNPNTIYAEIYSQNSPRTKLNDR